MLPEFRGGSFPLDSGGPEGPLRSGFEPTSEDGSFESSVL